VGILPDYFGRLIADPSEIGFISNELKRKKDHFDIILKSNGKGLPFEKLKDCFITEISYKFDTPEVKFHCNGVE
jgi:hypothetical protein